MGKWESGEPRRGSNEAFCFLPFSLFPFSPFRLFPLFLHPLVRVSFYLDSLDLRRHERWFLGVDIDRHELETSILLPVFDAVFPHSRLGTVVQSLRVQRQLADGSGTALAA